MATSLEDLIERMARKEPRVTSSAQSVSFQAYREAEKITDPEVLVMQCLR